MSSLDDKLKEILDQDFHSAPEDVEEAVAQIKQAFADWFAEGKDDAVAFIEGNSGAIFMTGPEFYERFAEEVNKIPDNTEISTAHGADGLPTAKNIALEAARRASGL